MFLYLSFLSRQLCCPLSLNQEAGIAAYVSSNMSAREGGGRGWERASPGEHRAFTEFRFCVPTADTAELTHKLMRAGGKKFPIQPLRGWASLSLSLSLSITQPLTLSLTLSCSPHPSPMMDCAHHHLQLTHPLRGSF